MFVLSWRAGSYASQATTRQHVTTLTMAAALICGVALLRFSLLDASLQNWIPVSLPLPASPKGVSALFSLSSRGETTSVLREMQTKEPSSLHLADAKRHLSRAHAGTFTESAIATLEQGWDSPSLVQLAISGQESAERQNRLLDAALHELGLRNVRVRLR